MQVYGQSILTRHVCVSLNCIQGHTNAQKWVVRVQWIPGTRGRWMATEEAATQLFANMVAQWFPAILDYTNILQCEWPNQCRKSRTVTEPLKYVLKNLAYFLVQNV